MKLANKAAIVTGGGSGIGKASALEFAAQGAAVLVADINDDAARQTAIEITAAGGNAVAAQVDVADGGQVREMVAGCVRAFGKLDVLFNNAGIEGEANLTAKMSEEGFDRVIAINLRGVFLGMKYALPEMVKAGGGAIVNTASIAGLVAVRGSTAYCAAKAGVIAMTRVAAAEYGRNNIRVNCICPGAISTPMVSRIAGGDFLEPKVVSRISVIGRIGEPEEIARMAAFLASDDASFATGAPFIVDGGWTVH